MKIRIALAVLISFVSLSFGQTPAPATPKPATPIPLMGAPVQTLQSVSAQLSAMEFQIALTTVPAVPESLQELLASFVALPTGVTIAQIRTVTVYVSPTGSARVVVQYLH